MLLDNILIFSPSCVQRPATVISMQVPAETRIIRGSKEKLSIEGRILFEQGLLMCPYFRSLPPTSLFLEAK